jgi:tetratricopeptide (TPR) repeat protein
VRYRLPDTLRQYALERLEEDADRGSATRARHAACFVSLAVRAEAALVGPEQGAWLDRLEQEHDNVRAALRWLLGRRDATTALRLGAALGRFWAMRGYLREGRERLADVLALVTAAGVPPSAAQVRALCGAGFLAWRQGDAVAARPLLQASVELGRRVGDAGAVGQALFYLGLVPQFQGDYPAARALFEESRAACTAAGDRHGLALALFGLGNLARQEGDDTAAQTLLERSLALFREVGDRRSLALPLGYLGRVALRQGDRERARAQLEEALAIFQEVGETWLIASLLDSLAEVARYEGDDARAESLLTRCLDLWRELGSTGTQAQGALHQLGHVALARRDAQRARALFGESLTLARQQGNKRHVAEALAGLAGVAAAADQPAAAARYFGAAEALRRAVGAALSPADQIDHQRAIAGARDSIGGCAFQAAWDAGAQSPLEAVVDEAASLEVGAAVDGATRQGRERPRPPCPPGAGTDPGGGPILSGDDGGETAKL